MQANIQEPVPIWPAADWEMINWIVEKGTLPLQDLNTEYFNHGADRILWSKHAKVLVPGGAGVKGHKANIEYFNVPAANGLLAHNAEGVGK